MKTIKDYPIKIIEGLPPKLSSSDRCAIDTEFFGMDKERLHRPVKTDGSPNGDFGCATFCMDGETVYFLENESDLQQALDNVSEAVWIFANMNFDITQMRRYASIPDRGKIWDILAIEKILYSGYVSTKYPSVKELTRRYLQTYMKKETRKEFSSATKFTPETKEYACYDALITWHIYQNQWTHATKTDIKIWIETELPVTWLFLSMRGFPFDKKAWAEISVSYEKRKKEIEDKYPSILLTSNDQVGKKLVEMGYDPPKTPKGKPQTNKKALEGLKNPNEFVKDLLEYSSLKSPTSTYGADSEYTRSVEPDGKIYPSINVTGTVSGRPSSSHPNLFNVPNARTNAAYRDCFIASEGKVLVVGDWSSQEPRIFAYRTQDEKLIDIFRSGQDVYCASAYLMFNEKMEKSDPKRNSRIKPVVLGASYGLSPWGLLREYQIPLEEGKEYLNAFFSVFTQADAWIKGMRDGRDIVYSHMGRKRYMNNYSYHAKNEVINHPIQSPASDIMKISMLEFVEEWDHNDILNVVYDEIILEVDEDRANDAVEVLDDVMVRVAERYHPGIPAVAEIAIGKTWSKAKV